jgi:hypothetical protein
MKAIGILALCVFSIAPVFAQKQELGLTLGGIWTGDRKTVSGTTFSLNSGNNLQASYGYRVFNAGPAQIYLGVHFLANDQRRVTSSDKTFTRDVATVYVTPDVSVKATLGPIEPWLTVGFGAAVYEQSKLRLDGVLNPASRDVTHGVFMAGGGIDVPIFRFIALRGEVREFYSGNPSYNTLVKSGQNNLSISGGFVIRRH